MDPEADGEGQDPEARNQCSSTLCKTWEITVPSTKENIMPGAGSLPDTRTQATSKDPGDWDAQQGGHT